MTRIIRTKPTLNEIDGVERIKFRVAAKNINVARLILGIGMNGKMAL